MRIFSVLIISTALSGCGLFDPPFIKACETALKERLRSPSTYKRIEVSRRDNNLSKNDYLEYLIEDKTSPAIMRAEIADFENGKRKPVKFKAFITYDAANAFGTPIRDVTECTYVSLTGDETNVSSFMVALDGKSNTDWILDSIKKK